MSAGIAAARARLRKVREQLRSNDGAGASSGDAPAPSSAATTAAAATAPTARVPDPLAEPARAAAPPAPMPVQQHDWPMYCTPVLTEAQTNGVSSQQNAFASNDIATGADDAIPYAPPSPGDARGTPAAAAAPAAAPPPRAPPKVTPHSRPDCILASTCPASHPHEKGCKTLAPSTGECRQLQIVYRKRGINVGPPGSYTSTRDAVEKLKHELAPKHVVPGSSKRSQSFVVRNMPREAMIALIVGIKVMEFLALVVLSYRSPPSMVWRVIIALYFMALADFHARQVHREIARSRHDAALELESVRDVESVEYLHDDKLLIFHDGGQTVEYALRLVPSTRCADSALPCLERQCCVR